MHTRSFSIPLLCLLGLCGLGGAGCEDPGYESESPDYLSGQFGEPTSGERGNMQVTEIGWAGSVSDEGVWDPDDVFVEFQNRHPRPINVSGWRLIIEGDQVRTHRLPTIQDPIQPNDFFVIAAKDDGAFQNADLIVPELKLGKAYVQVEFRDQNRKLIESAGSTSERLFTGGWDTWTTRSMERSQVIFGNQGGQSRAWHAYSDDVGFATIAPGWQARTLASPGVANSPDYSGSASAGGFE